MTDTNEIDVAPIKIVVKTQDGQTLTVDFSTDELSIADAMETAGLPRKQAIEMLAEEEALEVLVNNLTWYIDMDDELTKFNPYLIV